MTDEIDKLARAMKAATPASDQKAEILAGAMKSFDRHQEPTTRPRPMSNRRPFGRLWQGAKGMFDAVTTRGGMIATTALVAVGILVVVPRDALTPPSDSVVLMEPEVILGEQPSEQDVGARLADRDLASAARSFGNEGTLMLEVPAETEALTRAAPMAEVLRQMDTGALKADSSRLRTIVVEDTFRAPETDTEAFANNAPSTLKITTEDPVATFSADVDTAAYSVVRSSIKRGQMPPQEAVRIEELINYFPYAYPGPEGVHPFQPTVTVSPTPWNTGTQLVHIAVQGEMPEVAERPPLNLVFLIDTSGSMQDPNKLPLLKQSFAMMLGELRPEDRVAVVTYAGSAGQVLEPTSATERDVILSALDRLEAGGSTAGQAGLQQAYSVAEGMTGDGDVTRVILATDGDFNVGLSDPDALKDFIADKRDSGTYLSVLGFGRGNLDDATMQALAQNGNGMAAYIDTLSEARKVLVDQLTGALFPLADDLKFQVEFNPAAIAEYRLIGYETRALRREDFNNDRVDAVDIGAGHSLTAIFEVTPVGSDAVLTEPLRYEQVELTGRPSELGFLKMRYKRPGESQSTLIETPIPLVTENLDGEAGFAAAIAGFGSLLRGIDYIGDWSYADAVALANATKGEDPFGYRAEAITLMRLAETLDR